MMNGLKHSTIVIALKSFLGLGNAHLQFVPFFENIAMPLIRTMHKFETTNFSEINN